METFVWLSNPGTGEPWQCPAGAADVWRAKGWQDCEPPEPVDVTVPPAATRTAEPEAEPEPTQKSKAAAGRERGGDTTNTAPKE